MPRVYCIRCFLGIHTCERKGTDSELGREVEMQFKPRKALADLVGKSRVSITYKRIPYLVDMAGSLCLRFALTPGAGCPVKGVNVGKAAVQLRQTLKG